MDDSRLGGADYRKALIVCQRMERASLSSKPTLVPVVYLWQYGLLVRWRTADANLSRM